MYRIEMYGSGSDGKPAVDLIGSPFETIDAGAAKARSIGETNTFHRGKAAGYRIRDERKAVVFEGPAKASFALGFLTGQEMDWLLEAMRLLRDELPNIEVTVSSQYSPDLADALMRGRLDLAFLRPEPQMDDLRITGR